MPHASTFDSGAPHRQTPNSRNNMLWERQPFGLVVEFVVKTALHCPLHHNR